MAALPETDLQAANAAAKVAAFKKEEDDAQALQRQQVRVVLLYMACRLTLLHCESSCRKPPAPALKDSSQG